MRVLLVYPEMPDTYYAMRHFNKIIGKKAAFPPLGLLTIAAMLPASWEKKVVDLNVEPLTDAHLQWGDLLFLSALSVQEVSVRSVITRCQNYPIKLVAGGPLFTHDYKRFDGVDHFILNEGELTLPLFLQDLAAGAAKPIYSTPEFADITQTPIPAFGLVQMKHYAYAILQYSRGCPYLCDFCDVTALFGRRPRTKTAQQMIAELEAVWASGNVQLVMFADDNLIGNKKLVKGELLPALIKWRKERNPPFFFATQLTVNLADDPELMQLLADAGFRHVFIGIETPEEESLKLTHKTQNMKRNLLETVQAIHANGFIISAGFIVGFDTDTPQSYATLKSFIQQSGIPLPILNILKAPPGTELYARMQREGRLSKAFAFEEGDTNIAHLQGDENVMQAFLDITAEIYPAAQAVKRIKSFLQTYQYPKTSIKIRPKVAVGDFIQAIKIIVRLGIVDRNRRHFWELLRWTYVHKRHCMDKALFYGIMLYQMSQTYDHVTSQVRRQMAGLQNQTTADSETAVPAIGAAVVA